MPKRIEHKIVDGVELKRCGHCKEWKSLNYFHKNKDRWDGLDSWCKGCRKRYDYTKQLKQYRDNHKEEMKQYRSEHVEKIKKYNKQYQIEHVEEIKKQTKQYHKRSALYKVYADQICWCEEIRQDEELLEVKCAYCGRWMVPTNQQVKNRIQVFNGTQCGEQRFYCSENCRSACPTYGQRKYPKGFKQATSREVVPLLRQLVLKRDNYTCQKCGATTETAQLHVHHIIPYAQNKMQANDPDSCITLCKECHKEVHRQEGCKYNDLKCGENKNV